MTGTPKPPGPFVTVAEAARFLAVTPRTIRNWMAAGLLTVYSLDNSRAVRLDEQEVRALAQARPRTPPPPPH